VDAAALWRVIEALGLIVEVCTDPEADTAGVFEIIEG
jgi:hypothetical protein